MKRIMILLVIVMVAVLVGMQFPQKAFAQMSGGKVYEATRGEIFEVKDAAAIADLEAKARTNQCGVMYLGPKMAGIAPKSMKNAMRLFICGTGPEPYCITQAGKQVCYPPR